MELLEIFGSSIFINLVIWGIAIGVYKTKITTLEKNVADLKREHDDDSARMEKVLDTISISVARLDAKMDLLMSGKLNILSKGGGND